MGAGNVKAAYAHWGHLDHAPMRVLVFMAVTALDETEPRFWGGREVLSCALGRIVADDTTTDPTEIAERRAAFKALDRTLAALQKAGAISVVSRPCRGRNAVYGLNLAASQRTPVSGDQSSECTPVSGDRSGGEWTPVSGTNAPRSAGQWTPVSGAMDPGERGPYEYYEEVGLKQGQPADVRTAVTEVRASGRDDELPISSLRLIDGNPDAAGAGGQRPLLPAVLPGGRAAEVAQTIAAATARRAAARAAHTGESTG